MTGEVKIITSDMQHLHFLEIDMQQYNFLVTETCDFGIFYKMQHYNLPIKDSYSPMTILTKADVAIPRESLSTDTTDLALSSCTHVCKFVKDVVYCIQMHRIRSKSLKL